MAKQKKLSYPSFNNVCNTNFELLHIDTCGPFSVETVDGYRYFLTIVDDHSRATWVYLLRTKSEVLTVFPTFIEQVENFYNIKVKSVRSDNAQELQFTQLYQKKGIVLYHSCPETPEQNSVVERKHQHILNVARALAFQSGVHLTLWGDCILITVFLINRTPSQLLSNKTPHEVLTGKSPLYSQLKSFGCLCYASTSLKQRHKFLPWSKACVFLGYPSGYKGYKLMDLESNKVFITRNVLFHEDIFPLRSKASATHDFPINSLIPEDTSPSSDKNPYSKTQTIPPLSEISSTRNKKPPSYLQDYICNSLQSTSLYPISSSLTYSKLSPSYTYFINHVTSIPIPTSIAEAQKSKEWDESVDKKLDAMEDTNTWSVSALPPGKKAVGCRWIHSLKFNADSTLERRKSRLVAKGYTQKEGLNYNEMFSPVAKMATIKLLLKVAASKKWFFSQLDISNAFLNGELEEEIYLQLPDGYDEYYAKRKGDILPKKDVLRLRKSIYGLKQASRQWFKKLSQWDSRVVMVIILYSLNSLVQISWWFWFT